MQNKVKDDGAERKHIKRERDKMKWCGESQDSHYKLKLTAMPSEKGLSTAVPPPWAGLARLLSLGYWKPSGNHRGSYQTSLRPFSPSPRFGRHSPQQAGNKAQHCATLTQNTGASVSNTKDKIITRL